MRRRRLTADRKGARVVVARPQDQTGPAALVLILIDLVNTSLSDNKIITMQRPTTPVNNYLIIMGLLAVI